MYAVGGGSGGGSVAHARLANFLRRGLSDRIAYTRRTGCASATDVRSLPTIRHCGLFMEASTINQRNLLPRLAVGGAIFYGDRHLLPLLTPPATLPRRPSQWTSLLFLAPFSSFLLSYARPGKGRDSLVEETEREREREKRDSLRARIRRLPEVYGSEGSRISHVLISFRAPRISLQSDRRARKGETGGNCRHCENTHPYSA